MKVLAAIDIGTNTVRMLAAERRGNGEHRPLLRMRRITGLGKELRDTGALGEAEIRESLAALRAFRREMDRLGVSRVRACGTAALREASNSDVLVEAAEREAGIRIEVIGADEEAQRTWEGIVGRIPGAARAAVMDIGGGSTEFIVKTGRRVESASLPIGVVVTCATFPLSDPPETWETRNMEYFLAERIEAGTRRWAGRRFGTLVGTAGTFTTLAALDMRMTEYRPERIDGYRVTLSRLRRWREELLRIPARRRLSLPGMEKGRETFIVPGVCQAVLAMERLGARALVVSDAGILEGLIASIDCPEGEG